MDNVYAVIKVSIAAVHLHENHYCDQAVTAIDTVSKEAVMDDQIKISD